MAAVREPNRLTYGDYVDFPDDGVRRELIGGQVHVTPSPRVRHQRLVRRILVALDAYLQGHGGGEVFVAPLDVVLSEYDVVQPDVLVVLDAGGAALTKANLKGPPALAVEVMSDPGRDRRLKRNLYGRTGVEEYWLVDPDGDWLEVYRLEGAGYGTPVILGTEDTLTTPLLPGLSVNLADLFRD